MGGKWEVLAWQAFSEWAHMWKGDGFGTKERAVVLMTSLVLPCVVGVEGAGGAGEAAGETARLIHTVNDSLHCRMVQLHQWSAEWIKQSLFTAITAPSMLTCVPFIVRHSALKLLVAAIKADLALSHAVLAVVQAGATPQQQAVAVQPVTSWHLAIKEPFLAFAGISFLVGCGVLGSM